MSDNNNTNQIFEKFIRENLYPTPKEREFISEKYNELKDKILPSNIHVFQSGSYARTTACTPVWDLDIICDVDNPEEYMPSLIKLLRDAYKDRARIKEQTHSIGIYFGRDEDFSIDVVPVRQARELPKNEFGLFLYEMPEFTKHSKKWRMAFYESNVVSHSDPEWYREEALMVDKHSEGRFKKAVKFLKRWNYEMKKKIDDKDFTSFKSFHIEEIIKSYYFEDPTLWVHEAIQKFYQEGMDFLQKPLFLDRAAIISGQEFYIDEYVRDMPDTSKNTIQKYLNQWLELMEYIQNCTSQSDIEEFIKRLLFLVWPQKTPEKHTTVPKYSGSHFII